MKTEQLQGGICKMRRNLWKIVLIIAIAVLLLSGYFARRAQLETERKEIEKKCGQVGLNLLMRICRKP